MHNKTQEPKLIIGTMRLGAWGKRMNRIRRFSKNDGSFDHLDDLLAINTIEHEKALYADYDNYGEILTLLSPFPNPASHQVSLSIPEVPALVEHRSVDGC